MQNIHTNKVPVFSTTNKVLNTGTKNAFTLVELIVVITILAILWTIAFISLQWYSAQARDTTRVSDIQNIKKSLELFSLNTWKYPIPDTPSTVSYGTQDLWYQWTIWNDVTTNLSRNLNKKPTDPLTESEYIYSTISSQTQYELLSIYESDLVSMTSPQLSPLKGEGARPELFGQVNASNANYPKISWTYNWVFVKAWNYIIPTPSIINSLNTDIDLETNSWAILSQIITAWENNIENAWIEAKTWWLEWMSLQVFSWVLDKVWEDDDLKKQELLSKLQLAYTNTSLANDWVYKEIIETHITDTWSLIILIDNLVLNTTTYTSWWSNDWWDQTPTSSWCYYEDTTFTDANWWTTWELKYDEANDKCYVFWDEDTNAINACNTWVSENVSSSAWDFIWIPARYSITDWNGTWMNDTTYEREVVYNENNYVCRWFAVAKYEMSYDEEIASDSSSTSRDTRAYNSLKAPISMANRLSVVDITQPNAMTQCNDIWTHLITNNEWMAIARNIEAQNSNWSNWTVWDWYIDNWLDNITPANTNGTIWCYDDDSIYADPTWWETCSSERQLNLSNGTKIWDLAWNVREHVNKWNTLDWTNFNTNSFSTEAMCSNNTWWAWKWWYGTDSNSIESCTMISPYTKSSYWPAWDYNADNWMWRIYATYTEDGDNIFLRGGSAINGPSAGVFALILNGTSSSQYYRIGFRCVQ